MSSNCPDSDVTDGAVLPNEQWSSVSRHVANSYVEANNALLAAMGFSPSAEAAGEGTGDEPRTKTTSTVDPPVTEVAFGDETWLMERSTDAYDDLGVGDYVRFSKPIEATDVSAFAQVSGDTNRLHLAETFAEATQFDGRIAHGTLVAGTISAALARFPGLTVYLSQDLEFQAPVEIGETVTATCEIVEALGDTRYRLHTTVENADETTVIDGEAVVVIDEAPSPGDDDADSSPD
ncbi:MaoC family dehydratase [Natronolimnohabitans innermongolicus]|uniref:MaoC domain-containing protein dehydratase n=1 Tax=Natronolimnohabitans innermongolicus JCM 12255 TaxID=1227499 RepID=L9XHX7_9EURY|nr:MaoC family dehydratase [Natronolimnohabitans innermongolicus]ELY61212.1 MaoC domain-containing protein dehydratase [Natronolimnohabitans innermongolicus JCM 12255]